MFRNGFNATRRSLLTVAPSRPQPLPRIGLPSSKFVCVSCQFRSFQSKQVKKGKAAKSDTFLDAIQRLEAHVQHIEKRYLDHIQQQEALKGLPEYEITEDLQDRAYAALMAPPEAMPSFLPAPTTILDRLPAPVVARLGDTTGIMTQKAPKWDLVLSELEKNGGLIDLGPWEVNNLIWCMPVDYRAKLSKKLFGMMSVANVQPDTLTFDLLMIGHAAVKDSQEVKRLFSEIKERGLTPTVYSYGHLLKAYSQLSDVVAATHAVEEMHTYNIIPNLTIYTTLIQTCVSRRQYATAWEIFNLIKLKSTATAPDVYTYTLMIHACALNGEVERALDIFTDMTVRRGLEPTRETYHALIHACAMRKDYFSQAWKFATDMQRQGMTINKMYLNTLIQACGRIGELTRARLLVRHMMASNRERKNVQPDEITYQNLMRAYATYRAPGTEGKKTAGQTGRVVSESSFVGAGTGRLEKTEGETVDEKIPFLEKSVLQTHKDVLQEAKNVFAWIKSERPWCVSTQLLNSYMDVCLNQGGFAALKKCYDKSFSTEGPAKEEEVVEEKTEKPEESEEQITDKVVAEGDEDAANESPSSPQSSKSESEDFGSEDSKSANSNTGEKNRSPRSLPPRNIHTFEIALNSSLKNRDLPFARRIIADRNNFKLTKTYLSMFPEERKKHDFYAERFIVDILARCEFLGEAAERVRKTWQSGEWEWKEEDLKTLYTRAVQCEDWATVELCQGISGKLDKRY